MMLMGLCVTHQGKCDSLRLWGSCPYKDSDGLSHGAAVPVLQEVFLEEEDKNGAEDGEDLLPKQKVPCGPGRILKPTVCVFPCKLCLPHQIGAS
jgi:hypothetical protein